MAMLERGGFLERLGRENIFETKSLAIEAIYSRLDSAICRTCPARIFVECQSILPDGSARA
jgi:SulP family sulfate permease